MAQRKRGNMTPKAGVSKSPTRSFGKGGKKAVNKYACGGKKYSCGGKLKK